MTADEKRERQKQVSREWYLAHREYALEKQKQYRAANPEKVRSFYRQRLYGLSQEAFDALLAEQDGVCGICCQPAKKWFVDHCHESGRVRGVLCPSCNTAIGLLGDSLTLIHSAQEYLRKALI